MSDFEKVFQGAYDYCIDDSCKHCYEASKIFAKEIWNHQQQKIDAVLNFIDDKANAFCETHDMDKVALLEEIEELLK